MSRINQAIDIPINLLAIDLKFLENRSNISKDLDNLFSQEFGAVAGLAAQGSYYTDWAYKIRALDSGASRYLTNKLPRRKQVTNLHKQISRLVIALSSIVDLILVTNTQYSINSLPNESPIKLTEHAKRWLAENKPQEYYPVYDFSDPNNLPKIGAAVPGNMLSYLESNKPNPTYIDVYLAITKGVDTDLNLNKPDPNLLSKFISRSDPKLERVRQILTAFLNSLVLVNLPLSSVFSPEFDVTPYISIITRLSNISSVVIEDLDKAQILSKLASQIFTGNYSSDDLVIIRKLLLVDPILFNSPINIPKSNELLPQLIQVFNNSISNNESVEDLLDLYIKKSTILDGALGIPGNYIAAGLAHILKALFVLNDLTQGIVDPNGFRAALLLLTQGLIFINESKLSQFDLYVAQLSGLLDSMQIVDIDSLALESNNQFITIRNKFKSI